MMEHVPLKRKATVLELGCGEGFQLDLLRQRFERVFAIDPKHRPARASGFSFSVAEALPFRDSVFDLVVSNCVVEHLEDRRRAIEEALRVLRSGGYMAHVVPSRFWKAASLLLNPVGYPLRVAEKWWALRQAGRNRQASELTTPNERRRREFSSSSTDGSTRPFTEHTPLTCLSTGRTGGNTGSRSSGIPGWLWWLRYRCSA